MADLNELLGIEKLDSELANKESNYAIITYLDTMNTSEVNSKGEIVQFNRPTYAGQTDLISVSSFKRLSDDFPDRVKGSAIKYGNLENMLSYCFDKLKNEYSQIGETDSYCESKMQMLQSFERNGKLNADHQTPSSLEDMANKVFGIQESIRDLQSKNLSNSNSPRR